MRRFLENQDHCFSNEGSKNKEIETKDKFFDLDLESNSKCEIDGKYIELKKLKEELEPTPKTNERQKKPHKEGGELCTSRTDDYLFIRFYAAL